MIIISYFAYGSNLSVEQMKKVCPDSTTVGPARLEGFRLAFSTESKFWVWTGGVADIVKENGSEVWGLLYEISDADLELLDGFEEAPPIYRRIKVNVQPPKGSPVANVWSYEVVDKKEFVPPSNVYLEIIKSATVKYDFPLTYRASLDKIQTI